MRSFVSTAKLAFNISVNVTIGMSPFEVVHGYQARQLIYMISMAHHTRVFELIA